MEEISPTLPHRFDKQSMNNESKGQIVLFQTEDGQTKLEVQFQDETVWLSTRIVAFSSACGRQPS